MVAPTPAPGRIPLAVAIVDGAGVISHWNADAHRLFGVPPEDARGRSAYEVLPASSVGTAAVEVRVDITMDSLADADAAVTAALDAAVARAEERALDRAFDAVDDEIAHLDPDRGVEILFGADVTDLTVPSSGRYWTQAWAAEPGPRDVLWWVYPLLGPGGARLLAIATDGARMAAPGGPAHQAQSFGPTFAPHTAYDPPLDRPEPLAGRLLAMLPEMGEAAGGRVAEQVLGMGYPALDLGGGRIVPLAPGES
ncbi:PAS domain-containing protein [Streptomyces sp. 6N223]|uniref:PAS domain-containing protein n=1 Tax=Streptomyces sp. 6N223 TaxID=3457412 RepID=UPI003FD2A181